MFALCYLYIKLDNLYCFNSIVHCNSIVANIYWKEDTVVIQYCYSCLENYSL